MGLRKLFILLCLINLSGQLYSMHFNLNQHGKAQLTNDLLNVGLGLGTCLGIYFLVEEKASPSALLGWSRDNSRNLTMCSMLVGGWLLLRAYSAHVSLEGERECSRGPVSSLITSRNITRTVQASTAISSLNRRGAGRSIQGQNIMNTNPEITYEQMQQSLLFQLENGTLITAEQEAEIDAQWERYSAIIEARRCAIMEAANREFLAQLERNAESACKSSEKIKAKQAEIKAAIKILKKKLAQSGCDGDATQKQIDVLKEFENTLKHLLVK